MITQTLKRWLNKLFAWWPWKQSNALDYSQATNSLNRGTTPEVVWRTTMDGSVPQPGISSVAVEQGTNETTPESKLLDIDEHPEHVLPPYQPATDESLPSSSTLVTNIAQDQMPLPADTKVAPSDEQHLAFLHYLVKKGVYNEGFTEGQTPDQYRRSER
jgi:hypothetical protein